MRHLIVVDNPDTLAQQAVDTILESAHQAFELRGVFRLCLAGGSTPRRIYRQLAEAQNITGLDKPGLVLYWGDERCVRPDDPNSNYRMAKEELIPSLHTDNVAIHRMEGEVDPPKSAAQYESLLKSHFLLPGEPTFDLLLLGMGEDGHTASLFPHTAAVNEETHWVLGHYIPQLATWRLTLTPPVLNRARRILFMVSGETKAPALAQVLTGAFTPENYPAQIIRPDAGEMLWLVDRAAASQLPDAISG
jgi:6-phosphogluconolactonase